MNTKPILFNTDMVRAILDGTKTETRQVVKPRYFGSVFEMFRGELYEASPDKPPIDNGDGTTTRFVRRFVPCKPPYCHRDILYVRETFFEHKGHFFYKADGKHEALAQLGITFKWRPSVHMPREAARIFLRVTDVRVERLLDMSRDDAVAEGCDPSLKDIAPDLAYYRIWHEMESIWGSTIKKADRALYGWDANPWVWVIEFERCEKPEGG